MDTKRAIRSWKHKRIAKIRVLFLPHWKQLVLGFCDKDLHKRWKLPYTNILRRCVATLEGRSLFNLHFLREQQLKRELNNILFYPHHFVLCFFKELIRGILRSDVPGQKHFLACQVSCQCLWNRVTFNWLTCNFSSQFRYIKQMDDWNKTPCQLESDMLINIGEKSSFRGSKRGRKGGKVGGGGEGKAARLYARALPKESREK